MWPLYGATFEPSQFHHHARPVQVVLLEYNGPPAILAMSLRAHVHHILLIALNTSEIGARWWHSPVGSPSVSPSSAFRDPHPRPATSKKSWFSLSWLRILEFHVIVSSPCLKMPRVSKANSRLIRSAGPSFIPQPTENWAPHSISITTITVPATKKKRGSRRSKLKNTSNVEGHDNTQDPWSVAGTDSTKDTTPETDEMVVDPEPQSSPDDSELSEPSGNHTDVYISENAPPVRCT